MKKILTLSLLTLAIAGTKAQNLGPGVDSMEVNTLKVRLYSDGGMGNVSALDDSIHKTLVFVQNLWLGGLDVGNKLIISAQTYRQSRVDFHSGPITQNPNNPAYERCYHVKLSTISDFVNGNTTGTPQSIADWPAHGDTTVGEAYYLAPFVDVDQDGNYIPANGDYPDIKGDEALYAIFNDKASPTDTGFGVEIHAMFYGFNSPGTSFDSIIFVDYAVHNRSSYNYTDVYMGSFVDFDLGNPSDDLTGTNISANSVYTYNADGNDEGVSGFGTYLAAAGVRILKGPPADYFDGVDNDKDGCVDAVMDNNGNCISENPAGGIREHLKLSNSMYFFRSGNGVNPSITDPDNGLEHYNILRSQWKGGNDLIIENPSGIFDLNNGDGFVASNQGNKTNYFYPGNTFDTTGAYMPSNPINWFMAPSNFGDMRTLGSAGPFSMKAGQSFEMTHAIVWTRDSTMQGSYTSINNVLSNLGSDFNNQPNRNIGLPQLSAQNRYQVFYEEGWWVQNKEEKELNFKLVSSGGQVLKTIQIGAFETKNDLLGGLPSGVYLLVEEAKNSINAQTFKLIR